MTANNATKAPPGCDYGRLGHCMGQTKLNYDLQAIDVFYVYRGYFPGSDVTSSHISSDINKSG